MWEPAPFQDLSRRSGHEAGSEVAQLYLTDPAAAVEPPYQLKGFKKVSLAIGIRSAVGRLGDLTTSQA